MSVADDSGELSDGQCRGPQQQITEVLSQCGATKSSTKLSAVYRYRIVRIPNAHDLSPLRGPRTDVPIRPDRSH